MFNIDVEEISWGGQTLRLETGRVARQADGAIFASMGETTVLATAVAARSEKPGIDFFPLTVNYQEKTYAAGKIPGGYFKREGRPTERETLISRLIDRPIRPLFVEGFRNETQVIATVLSYDLENDTDILALVASSAALTLSGIPFMGPVGAARVGYINGEYILNPTIEQQKLSELDLVVAGTQDAVLMVESEAKELSEEIMLGAVMFGHRGFQPVIEAIIRLAERSSRSPRDFTPPDHDALYNKVKAIAEADVRAGYAIPTKEARQEAVAKAKDKVLAELTGADKADAAARQQDRRSLQASREGRGPQLDPRYGPAHRRPRHQDGPQDRRRSIGAAAHPWFGAVHPRRNPGAGGHHARHRRGRAVYRLARRHPQGHLHAAL